MGHGIVWHATLRHRVQVTKELIQCTELFREWFALIDRESAGCFHIDDLIEFLSSLGGDISEASEGGSTRAMRAVRALRGAGMECAEPCIFILACIAVAVPYPWESTSEESHVMDGTAILLWVPCGGCAEGALSDGALTAAPLTGAFLAHTCHGHRR